MGKPRIAKVTLRRLLYITIICACLVMAVGGTQSQQHGVRRVFQDVDGNSTYVNRDWGLLYLDGASVDTLHLEGGTSQVRFSGTIWQGASGSTTWRVVHNANITLRVNGETLLNLADYSPTAIVSEVPVRWAGNTLEIEVRYQLGPALEAQSVAFGVYEETLSGWQLIPAHRLYRDAPDPATAQREVSIYTITQGALVVVFVGIIALLLSEGINARVWRSPMFRRVSVLVLFALIVRLWVLADRATLDSLFHFLPPVTDNYVMMGRTSLNEGTFLSGAYYNPGMILWFSAITRLFGPALLIPYLIHAIIGALSIGAVSLTGWRIYGRYVGLTAGIIGAVYPPLVFFQTTLQPEALLVSATALLMCGGLWTIHTRQWYWAAMYGVTVGLAGLLRANSLPLIAALPLTLFVLRQYRASLRLTAIAALFAFIAIIPQAMLNFAGGTSTFISSNGGINLYAGNNRDGDGTFFGHTGQAWHMVNETDGDYVGAFLSDLRADPTRMALLQVHKLGLFWQEGEIANNVNFYSQGAELSAPLKLPFTLPMLGILGLAGVLFSVMAEPQRRAETLFIAISVILFTLATVMFFVISRQRIPVVSLLLLPAGLTISELVKALITPTADGRRRLDRRWVVSGVISIGIFALILTVGPLVPRKPFWHGDLPSEAVPFGHEFGDVRLLGYEVEQLNREAGFVYITLYWELAQQTTQNHDVFVHLTHPTGERITGQDAVLGGITYPITPTSTWSVGTRLAESYFVKIPYKQNDLPDVIGVSTGLYGSVPQRLFHIGLADSAAASNAVNVDSKTLTEVDFRFGDALHLTGAAAPEVSASEEAVRVVTRWALTQPLHEDFVLFFHVLNADGEIVAQSDERSLAGSVTTSALLENMPFIGVRDIPLPDDLAQGVYTIVGGFYRLPDVHRVSAYEGSTPIADSLIPLGQFTLN